MKIKHLLGLALLGPALLIGAQSAKADVTTTLSLSDGLAANSTDATSCGTIGGSYTGGVCSVSTTGGSGQIASGISYDGWNLLPILSGFPAQGPEGFLWFNSFELGYSGSVDDTLQITGSQSGLTSPTGSFNLLGTFSGTTQDNNVSASASSYYDLSNGLPSLNPISVPGTANLLDTLSLPAGTTNSLSANTSVTVDNPPGNTYSLYYTETITDSCASNGGCNGLTADSVTLTGTSSTLSTSVPAPTPLALFGLGLVLLGGLSAKRRIDARG